MRTPRPCPAVSFLLTAALLALSEAHVVASAVDGSRRELHQFADAALGTIPSLLKSIHCFPDPGVVSIFGTDWEPATSFLASGNEINHKAVENTPEGSVLSSACEAASTSIDFVFPVPPKCPLVLRLYFADATNTTRPVSIITNNLKQGSDYNIGLSGNGGDTVELKMPETAGLLELRILALSELPAIISGLQILSTGECTQSSALDTTGESDSEADQAVLVYRMACSSILPQADTISTDINQASSAFINEQKDFVARMGDATSQAQLFESLCLPAVDADHLEVTLPLRDGTTFEVILFFTKSNTQAWSDIMVSVNGHDVFAETRLKFKPGPGEEPAYLLKRFEVRAGPDGVKLVVSSRNGFPPISGLEAWQITAKSASVGMTLLDRPDDRIVVACASKVFKQTPKGEILYPGPQAFTSAGLQMKAISGSVAPENTDLQDLVQGGAFLGACQKAEGQTITATFSVEQGQPYTISFFWVEFEDAAAAGSRVLSVSVDGIAVASGVDIFKDVGRNTAVGFAAPVTSIEDQMTVAVKSEVGKPMISAIAVDGPGVDAAAADKHDVNQVTGLSKAAACGAPGPNWDPIEGITAAGFKKFTAEQEIKGVEGEQQALYATHCFAVDGGTITMQLPVVPKARLRVVLHFAEVFFEERGLRTFDVVVNGVPQFKQLDIVAEAGAFSPLVKEFTFVPAGPTMVLELVSVVDNALINGIEIYSREVINTQEAGAAVPAAAPAAAPTTATPAAAPTPAKPMVKPPTGPPCVPPEDIAKQTGLLGMEPGAIGFGEIAPDDLQGNFAPLRLSNKQEEALNIAAISCTPLEGLMPNTSTFFIIQFGATAGSQRVQCGAPGKQVPVEPAFTIPGGQDRITTALFEPTDLLEAAATLTMHGVDGVLGSIVVTGMGGDPWAKAHTLHPVIDGDTVFAEPDEFGGATILIDGSTSHTHAPGREMAAFLWEDAGSEAVIGKDQVLQCWYPFGTYTVSLTVTDNRMETAATSITVVVAPESKVPDLKRSSKRYMTSHTGTLLQVYDKATALDPLPEVPTMAHMATAPFTSVPAEQPEFGPFLVRMLAQWYHPGGAAKMAATGAPAGTQPLIGIDGDMLAQADFTRPEGTYLLDVRLLMPEPATVQVTLDGGPISSSVSDVSKHPPIINELSTDATARPGNIGLVKGFLLQTPATISVGGKLANITEHERSSIAFTYPELPPGNHSITVDRNGLISNPKNVELLEESAGGGTEQGGPFADTPKYTQKAIPVDVPARLAWCHGKLYVASAYAVANTTGRGIIEFTFDSNYEVVDQRLVIATPQPFPPANEKMAWSILGLACDPRDDDRTFKLYFTLSPLYTQGGEPPKLPAPYYGKVMYVQPAVPAPKAVLVVDNISVSNGDHVVNGIDFLHDGRLIIAVGSQTNAGIEGALGLLPDNPTCTNLLVADVQNPDFNGVLAYKMLPGAPATHTDPNDQRYGDWVTQTNDYVKYYATGTRNPYDVRVGIKGNVMVTINGPNFKFGATLEGVDAQLAPKIGPDPETDDAIWLDLKEGCHCGAPNIARCRAGAKHECFYTGMDDLKDDYPTQCPPDTIITSSIGGIAEYHSYAFGGVSHDKVFIAGYKKHLVRYDPIGDKQVTDKDDAFYPPSPGLDVIHAPGGVHIVASMEASKLLVNIPVDATVAASGNPSVYDIKPDRGMTAQPGPNTFILGGANFDAIQGVPTVLFGKVPANKVAVVGPGWITGHVPPNPEGTCNTDITLQFGATSLILPEAFCYIAP